MTDSDLSMSLQQVIAFTGGRLITGGGEASFARVITDSRQARPGDLFVALLGERFDGHDFVEQALYLKTLGPRHAGYDVLSDTRIDESGVRALAEAADRCWQAILEQDIAGFGASMRQAFEGQISMFPHMMNPGVQELIDQYRDRALGWKLSGAGGGGYLILVADRPIEHSVRVVVRRERD